MELSLEIHPLDFDALVKDTTISMAQVERIYNVRCATSPEAFRLCLLRLKEDIERNRSDLLCRVHGNDIRIMTDAEANDHTWDEYRRGVRKIAKQAKRRCAIDHGKLETADRRVAELRDAHITAQAIMNRRELAKFAREKLLAGDIATTDGKGEAAAAE